MKNQISQDVIEEVGKYLSLKTGGYLLRSYLESYATEAETHFYALNSDKCISVKSSRTRFYLTSSEGWSAEIFRAHMEEF